MSNTQWETLSVQAIAVVAVVYFLAFLAHLVEWSALRRPASSKALVGTGGSLVITTGGLGPTADDLTAEVVGTFQGRPSALDPALEQRIATVVERLTARRGWSLSRCA